MNTSLYFLFYLYLDWDRCNQRGLIKALAEEVYPHKVICINRPADLLVGGLRHQDNLANSFSKQKIQYIKDNLLLFRPFFPLNDYVASWIPGFNSLQCLWLRILMTKLGLTPESDDRVIIWLFNCIHWPFTRLFPGSRVVYHPVDEYTLTVRGERRIQAMRHEQQMLKNCDMVFTLSEGLARKKALLHSNVHCLGQGVSLGLFSQSMHQQAQVPEEFLDIPPPRIGLVGNLRDWIDFSLINGILRQRPEWSIVFIGPQDRSAAAALESLQQYPNFFWLGARLFQELPRWLAGLDVGILPYLQTEFTKFVNPTKLYEYWAAGLPVVTTNIGELRPLKDCLWIAEDIDEFIIAIQEALHGHSPSKMELRTQLAKTQPWETLAKRALGYLHDSFQDI